MERLIKNFSQFINFSSKNRHFSVGQKRLEFDIIFFINLSNAFLDHYKCTEWRNKSKKKALQGDHIYQNIFLKQLFQPMKFLNIYEKYRTYVNKYVIIDFLLETADI